MLELPDDPTDPLKLADWLELRAMLDQDRNSSRGDLTGVLRRAALVELDSDDAIERKAMEAFEELEQREKAAKEAYPFEIYYRGVGVLQLKSDWRDFPAYAFCLCLSYFELKKVNKAPQLFEQISCQAAKGYLRGDVIGFGAPRRELPSSFSKAVTKLCDLMGEGGRYRKQPSLQRKDDTLDLVAWKNFNDKWSSKILMFGQCAAGRNWEDKLGDLQPHIFWDQWMQDSLVSPTPIKSFFVPHRIGRNKWNFVARKAGIFFDRCRIAFWAHQEKADCSSHITWIRGLLRQVSS